MRTRDHVLVRVLVALGAASVAALFVGVVVLLATQHRETPTAPDYRVTRVGGIEYEAMAGRPIDPADPVDRAIIAGLPAGQRDVGNRQTLFGAFIGITNDSSAPLPTAERIELRDEAGRIYRPLALPATNPFAYTQRMLRPGTRIPASGSVADADLAAGGRLLLFRIPKWNYRNGDEYELVIHDPSSPGTVASLIV